jgi:DNA-directed RNA polymerase specialized sigma24 family protein
MFGSSFRRLNYEGCDMRKQLRQKDRSFSLACAFAVAAAAAVSSTSVAAQDDQRALSQIQSYCTVSWQRAGIDPQDWEDCTQQAILELLEQIGADRLPRAVDDADSGERDHLRRCVWRITKRWKRRPRAASYQDDVHSTAAVCPGLARPASEWDDIRVFAFRLVSERQSRILDMARDGWRVAEIANELRISPARVSDEKHKAVRKLKAQFQHA